MVGIRSKKAEGSIVANLILFVAVMGMAGATAIIFKNMIDANSNAASEEGQRTTSVLRTDFTITSATYNAGDVIVYVKNTGKEPFDPEDMDIYLDGIRIPRDTDNRTVEVMVDTDLISVGVWDENEELEFVVNQTYAAPQTHSVVVYTPNGVKAESTFSS